MTPVPLALWSPFFCARARGTRSSSSSKYKEKKTLVVRRLEFER